MGKSALVLKFVKGQFVEEYDPTIEDLYRHQFHVDGKSTCLEILDTAGQDEFRAIRDQMLHLGQGFLLLFSVTDRGSFQELTSSYEAIQRSKDFESVPLVVVGTKCDLVDRRQISPEEGKAQADLWGAEYVETSALDNINVQECFAMVVRQLRAIEDEKENGSKKGKGKKSKRQSGSKDESKKKKSLLNQAQCTIL